MSFKKSFFKNIFISGSYTYVAQLIIFISSFITSRLLAPEDFGLVGLIAVFSGFITIFSDSGISMAVIRSGYKQTYYRGLNFLSLIIGIVLCVVTIILIYPIAFFYNNPDIILPGIAIAFVFVLKSLSIVPVAVMQKELRFGAAGRVLLISVLAGMICTIIMAYMGFRYWSLIWSQYVIALVAFVITRRLSPQLYLKTTGAAIKKSFLLARTLISSLTGFNIINYWARNADNLLVGKFYGTAELGIYNRAYMMLQMPLNLITGIFSAVLLPTFVRHKNEGGNVEHEYYFLLKVISLINLPIAVVLILFPEGLVTLLWGQNWLQVADLLPYFGLLVMTQTLTSTLGNLLVVQKEEKTLMYSGWIGAVFMVTGIVFGATISLQAIAAFYALSYIILVLPLNVIYVFAMKLKFTSGIISFWIPKMTLSLILWIAIYNELTNLLLPVLFAWVILVCWDARKELLIISGRLLLKSSKT